MMETARRQHRTSFEFKYNIRVFQVLSLVSVVVQEDIVGSEFVDDGVTVLFM